MAGFDFTMRSEALLGKAAMDRLSKARIGIAGLGGVGGAIAPVVARLGIGHITAGDPGSYDLPDLNRQAGAFRDTLGLNKSDVFSSILRNINPSMTISMFNEGLTFDNIPEFVDQMDVVVDTLDITVPVPLRLALHKRIQEQGKYAIVPPIVGFGNVVAISSPGGFPMDPILGMLAKATASGSFPAPLKKVFNEEILDVMGSSMRKGIVPSLSLAANLSGSIVANEILMIVCRDSFAGWRAPVTLPRLIVADLLSMKTEIIDIQEFVSQASRETESVVPDELVPA